jgi:hypothetical protein
MREKLTFETALLHLRQKFTSGNEIPVTMSSINREEYEALMGGVAELLEFKRETLLKKLEKLEKRK